MIRVAVAALLERFVGPENARLVEAQYLVVVGVRQLVQMFRVSLEFF